VAYCTTVRINCFSGVCQLLESRRGSWCSARGGSGRGRWRCFNFLLLQPCLVVLRRSHINRCRHVGVSRTTKLRSHHCVLPNLIWCNQYLGGDSWNDILLGSKFRDPKGMYHIPRLHAQYNLTVDWHVQFK
jgi:hypothetical protein